MTYWLVMFRPETFEIVKAHGVIGAHPMHRRRFQELSQGDKFFVYISRSRLLDGYGTLTSNPFDGTECLFGTGKGSAPLYPLRCGVKLDSFGMAVECGSTLWGLSEFTDKHMKTDPANYLRCYGGFMKISNADYDWLVKILQGAIPAPTPVLSP